MEAGSNLFPNSLFLAYPIFFAFFRRVGRFRFSGVKRQGLGQTRFYGENTTCNEMEVWRLSSKRLAAPTFFVRGSPELPLPLTTNNRSRHNTRA